MTFQLQCAKGERGAKKENCAKKIDKTKLGVETSIFYHLSNKNAGLKTNHMFTLLNITLLFVTEFIRTESTVTSRSVWSGGAAVHACMRVVGWCLGRPRLAVGSSCLTVVRGDWQATRPKRSPYTIPWHRSCKNYTCDFSFDTLYQENDKD